MQLYSITYDQLTLISIFNDKGVKTGDREERVRVSMHDLPLQTAQMYRDKMKGLNFVMIAQAAGRNEEPRSVKRSDRRKSAPVRATASPAQPTQQQKIAEAARTGDMTAAINNRSK